MKYDVVYMTPPTMSFEEIDVLTPTGSGKRAGSHKWNPVTIAFNNADEVFEHHRSGNGEYFCIEFSAGRDNWKLTQCQLISRSVAQPNEFTMTYISALYCPNP